MAIQEPYPNRGKRRKMNERGLTQREWQWPGDYVSLDGGAMWVRPDCVTAFRRRGWTTLDAIMGSDQVHVMRTRSTRDNSVLTIETDGGQVQGYLKRQRVRTRSDWRRERGTHRAADTPGMAEAEAVRWCRAAGVPTMNIIAAGCRRNAQCQRQSDSFFLSENLSGCLPACDLWHDDRITAEARRRALAAMADTTRRLHAAGLFHYDLYLDHFFLPTHQLAVPAAPVTAHLIDLQRLERLTSPLSAWRAEVKDLGQFYGSCQYHGVSAEERELWAQHYFGSGDRQDRAVGRANSAKLAAAQARWELRQLRRRVQTQVRRAGTLFS